MSPPERPLATTWRTLVGLLDGRGGRRNCGAHPEVRKAIERGLERLTVLAADLDTDVLDGKLREIIDTHEWLKQRKRPTEGQAWGLVDLLHAMWLDACGPEALKVELEQFTECPPRAPLDPDEHRYWLRREYIERQRAGVHQRAWTALRARYLRNAGIVLGALVMAAWAVALTIAPQDGVITLCALAGAIGGALSGARSLRDNRDVNESRVFQTWWWVQPIVGGAVGLLVYALLVSPVLTLPGTNDPDSVRSAAARIVYAFLAGFSEPWLLRVVERLGGTADKAAASTQSRKPAADFSRQQDDDQVSGPGAAS